MAVKIEGLKSPQCVHVGGGPTLSEDVRVVKELALRSNGEIRVGSNPTPRSSLTEL